MLAITSDRTGGTPRWTSLFLKKNGRQQDKRQTAKVPSKIERILVDR